MSSIHYLAANSAKASRSLRTRCRSLQPQPSIAKFSTHVDDSPNDDASPPPPPKKHPQSFVNPDIHLSLGENLPPNYQNIFDNPRFKRHPKDGKDSYWRPPWNNRAEIISAEDFANRPRVSFSENFASMHDAMVVLSWMEEGEKKKIYDLYLQLMGAMAGKADRKKTTAKPAEEAGEDGDSAGSSGSGGSDSSSSSFDSDQEWQVLTTHTSHEYVIRVVAQTYNITTSHAAGIIQLQHNEEQLKKDPNFVVRHDVQAHVDRVAREEIREIYKSYGEKDPLIYVEDPLAATGRLGKEDQMAAAIVKASDLSDVDALWRQTRKRETEDAIKRIANHIYVEDVDERTVKVKVDKEVKRLLKTNEEFMKAAKEERAFGFNENAAEEKATDVTDSIDTPETNEEAAEAIAANDPSTTPPTEAKSIDANDTSDEVAEAIANPAKPTKPRTKVPKIPSLSDIPPNFFPTPSKPRRPRYKYAAQIINEHKLGVRPGTSSHIHSKKLASKRKAFKHGRVIDGNVIVEQGGKLRVASVAELEQTSWKHVRNESEFMFRGVKQAWLRRELEGEVGGWGLQEEVNKLEDQAMVEGADGEEEEVTEESENEDGEVDDEDEEEVDEQGEDDDEDEK